MENRRYFPEYQVGDCVTVKTWNEIQKYRDRNGEIRVNGLYFASKMRAACGHKFTISLIKFDSIHGEFRYQLRDTPGIDLAFFGGNENGRYFFNADMFVSAEPPELVVPETFLF
ncbi:MAG: hypothetical protein IJV14_10850 [Lachnospiraceae bacterium]|nr:hypothetical protein [Lachnospiraceae bacterium]